MNTDIEKQYEGCRLTAYPDPVRGASHGPSVMVTLAALNRATRSRKSRLMHYYWPILRTLSTPWNRVSQLC